MTRNRAGKPTEQTNPLPGMYYLCVSLWFKAPIVLQSLQPQRTHNPMVDSERQCTATAKSTGERCQRAAIKGGTVCHVHGGAAEQVRQKANERLDEMADSTTASIQAQIEDLEREYEQAVEVENKLAIMSEMRRLWKILLDRTGNHPKETREHTGEDGGPIEVSSDVVTVHDE